MPWGWFKWPEYLKKKACRYLLQHYLGNYLETKISLEDLTINLYNGTATVSNVPLSAEALNESLQNVNAPIRIVSGCIGEVNVTIPWKALIRDNCTVQISGLKLVVTPQVFSNYTTGAMMTESLLFSTMSASLQVAEELLKTKSEEEEKEAAGYEGMEAFARAIEIVLARVKVSLTDTVIQVNYENTDSSKLFLRLRIERIDFFDERSRIPSDEEAEVTVQDIAVKILELSKPLLEFGHESCEQDHINPSPLDTLTRLRQQQSDDSVESQVDETSGVLVGMASGQMEVKVKVKQTETIAGPKLEIEGFLAAIHFLFTHEDLLLLIEMINGIIKSSSDNQRVIPLHKYQHNIPGVSRPMQSKDRDQVERQLQRHMEQSRPIDHQRRDPWDLQSSRADSSDDFHSLEINAGSDLTSSTVFTEPNTTSVYSDTSASIYKSTFNIPPESPLSPDFPMQKPFPFKDPTKKISIPAAGAFAMPDRGPLISQRSFGGLQDTSVYKFTVSCFTFALLHKKPYYKSVDVETSVDPEEYLSLNDRGELCPLTYFDSMSQAVLTGRVLKGSDPNDKISQVLPLDHLLLSAQTVNTTVNVIGLSTELHLSVGGTNIREYIYQNHLSRITKPVAINSFLTLTEDVHNVKPGVELNYSFTDDPEYKRKLHRFGKQFSKDGKVPEAKLGVELHSVHVELDPTLLDRLNVISKIPSFSRQSSSSDSFEKAARSLYLPMSNANLHKQDYFDAAMGDHNSVKQQTTIVLTCNALDIMLKFPVPDLREAMSVKLCNQPRLRQEVCYADVSSLMFKTCLDDSKLTKYELQLDTLKAYLSASGLKEDRILFLLVEADRHDNNRVYSDLPRIVYETRTVLESELEDDLCTEEHNAMDDSSFLPSFNKKPSPFATSKTMFETNETGKSDEWKEEVMPGSRDEIHQFEETTRDRASNVLKCFIPVLRLHLPNQSLYSKLYHRFGQDLPLWQSALMKQSDKSSTASVPSSLYPLTSIPTIHHPLADPMTDPMTQTIRPHHIQQQPSSFKPLHSKESSGEEDEDDGRVATVIPKQLQESKHNTTTTTVLSLVVGRAQLSLCTDLPCPTEVINVDEEKEKLVDVDSPKRTPLQSDVIGGIVVFDVTQFTLSSITGYNGDPTMDYLCLQIDKFNISHYSNFDMERFSTYSCVGNCPDVEKLLHAHLLPIITPAPGNTLVSSDCDAHKRDPMLAIAMEVTSDPTNNTKTNKCAIAVRNGLLEYFVTPSELNCFTQLIQFFAIQNEEVPGYVPRPVVTALHVHFIDSTAVYRPKYLPWQIAFGLSAAHFSTTLASAATTSMMRLIIDESYIFLTNKPEKNLDLKQDYVCVVEIGLLEINIKMQTGDISESLNIPEISLEFSNNLIEFRTCVDTCAGLRDLIQYIASYGDLRDFVFAKAKSFDSCKDETESTDGFSTPLGSLTSNTSIPLPSGINQMDLMDDAMEELAIEKNTGGNKRTDKVYKPLREKRKSPGTKRKSSYKKPSTESKLKLSNPNLKSIKVPVNFSDSDDDSHGAVNKKMITGKQTAGKFPLSPARSSMSSTVTSEESEDDFLILDLPISSKMAKGAKPVVKSYLNDDEILKIEYNHFTPSNSFTDQLHRPENFPVPVTMYTLKDMNLIWYLYGGSDFQKSSTPSPASSSSDHSTSPAMKHKDFHSRQEVPTTSSPTSQYSNPRRSPHSTRSHGNSRYKRTSNISDATYYKKKAHKGRMLNWKVAGGPDRNHDIVMELHINKLRMQHEVYPEDKEQSSRFVLLVREIELVDRLAASQLNKFLSQYVSNTMPKQTHANMVSFKMLSVRTELEEYPEREEVIIHASALPLRLYVDQDALEFLMNFMADLSTTKSAETPPAEVFEQPSPSTEQTSAASTPDPVVEPPYFKEFSFYPSVVIKIDYEAKRFDMEKGVIPGILVGLSHLDSAEIELKSLKFCGVKGWDRLLSQVVSEWTGDVKSQLPKILGGVGPMHYLMQFAQGVVDFVWLPVQQYQQDGRVVRGLQRGATSLAASTGMATVELTTRLVQTIEFVAATTYDLVAPVERNSNSSLALQRRRNPRRPQDFRSGVSSAWNTLTTGINDTAGDLYHTVTREHDDGVARTLGDVLRQVPGVVVRPILIASEATRHVLGGVRNQLMPDARKEELAKYRDDT